MNVDGSPRFLTIEDVLAIETFDRCYGSLFDFNSRRTQLAIAIRAGIASAPRAGPPLLLGADRSRLHVVDLTTRASRHVIGPEGYGLFSPVWSPDDGLIATAASDGSRICPCIVDPKTGTTKLLGDCDLYLPFSPASPVGWVAAREIACRVLRPSARPRQIELSCAASEAAIDAWSKQSRGEHPTASAWSTGQADLSEQKGELAVIDVETETITCFPDESLAPRGVTNFALRGTPDTTFESQWEDRYAARRSLFENQTTGASLDLIRCDDGSTALTWRSHHAETTTSLLECNAKLRDIRKGEVGDLQYALANGQQAVARYILPPGWHEGERRAAVMFVYPETVYRAGGPEHRLIDVPSLFNLHLLAARGYIVIEPSLPFDRESQADLVDSLAAGVGPAIDAADAAGLIDKRHIHVMGHSRGGWAVMALLATTKLFRSGIALAGFSDLFSLHGRLDVRDRYRESYSRSFALGQMCECSFSLPGPPAHNVERYLHNSPLHRVQDIEAPLLMLHGDLDPYPPIDQSEAMFQALHHLGKEAELVRYWGEEHIFTSPANIRDAFTRIIDWLQTSSPVDD